MAVPKKKMSKSRRNIRKSAWKKKIGKQVLMAFSLGKSLVNSKQSNFVMS